MRALSVKDLEFQGIIPYMNRMKDLSLHFGTHILDVGCAKGRMSSIIKELCHKGSIYVGYDIDEISIAQAKQKYNHKCMFYASRDELFDHVRTYGLFDTLLFANVLHDLEKKTIEEYLHLLKKGGKVCIIDHHKKGMTAQEFLSSLKDMDKEWMQKEGFETFYAKRTKINLYDCISLMASLGIDHLSSKGPLPNDYFYTYIGVKEHD